MAKNDVIVFRINTTAKKEASERIKKVYKMSVSKYLRRKIYELIF